MSKEQADMMKETREETIEFGSAQLKSDHHWAN